MRSFSVPLHTLHSFAFFSHFQGKAFPYVYLSLIIFLTEVGLESQGTATFMSTTFEGMKNRKNCVRLNYKKLMSVAQQTNKVTKVMLRIIRVTTNPKETFLSMTRNNWRQRLLVWSQLESLYHVYFFFYFSFVYFGILFCLSRRVRVKDFLVWQRSWHFFGYGQKI